MRLAGVTILFTILALQTAWGSSADSRPIRGNYQKWQLYEQLMSRGLPRPLPEDPSNPSKPPPYCDRNDHQTAGCVMAVCQQLPSMECSRDEQVKDIACQCTGVNGQCVTAVCNHLDRFACDEKRELMAVVQMCRGVEDATCIDRLCSQLGRFECDDMSDLRRVTELCQ